MMRTDIMQDRRQNEIKKKKIAGSVNNNKNSQKLYNLKSFASEYVSVLISPLDSQVF